MRRPYDDGYPSGQGRCGVAQRHVKVLSHIDCEHVTVKRTGSIRRGARGQRGRPEHEWPAETVRARDGEERAEGAEETAAVEADVTTNECVP